MSETKLVTEDGFFVIRNKARKDYVEGFAKDGSGIYTADIRKAMHYTLEETEKVNDSLEAIAVRVSYEIPE